MKRITVEWIEREVYEINVDDDDEALICVIEERGAKRISRETEKRYLTTTVE